MAHSANNLLALSIMALLFGVHSIRTEDGTLDELATDIEHLDIDSKDELEGQPDGWKGCCFDPMEQTKVRGQAPPGGGAFKNLAPAVCCVCGDGQVRVGANWKCNVCKSKSRGGVACAHKLTELEEKNAHLKQGDGLCKTDFWSAMGLLVNDQGKKISARAAQTEPCNRLCEKHLACTAPNCKSTCPTGAKLAEDNINKMTEDFEGVVGDIVEHIAEEESHLHDQELEVEKIIKDEEVRDEIEHVMEDTLMVDNVDEETAHQLDSFSEEVDHNSAMFNGKNADPKVKEQFEEEARDKMMTDTLEHQEKIELEIDDQETEIEDLEKQATAHHESQDVINDIKGLEKEVETIEHEQDALVDDIEESSEFLDGRGDNEIEALSLEETISEDKDVLREEMEQMQNLKDVYGDLTDRGEKAEVAAEFNEEKKLAAQEQSIIQKEEALETLEEQVNKGGGSKNQVYKDEQEIEKLSEQLAVDDATEILHEDVTMDKLEDAHPKDSKLIEDAHEVDVDGQDLEFDMEMAISDEDVLFVDDTSALKTGGKVGGEVGDATEQAFKAEQKFQEDQEELIERHGVEETVEAEVEKKPC